MTSPPEFVSRTLFSQGVAGDNDDQPGFMCKENYDKILERKATSIKSLFTDFISADRFDIIPSPKLYGFRQRCRFGIMRNELDEICFSIWERGENTRIDAKFEVASDSMNAAMDRTRHLLRSSPKYAPLIRGISAINFHENREGSEMLITLCNGQPLCPNFPELAGEMAAELNVKAVVGRARKEKAVSNNSTEDFVTESMQIVERNVDSGNGNAGDGAIGMSIRTMKYTQPEGSFSNPNGDIAELTANWLCDKMRCESMKAQKRKFIEFYCGNANHGCYLAEYFTEVLGVEIDPELCSAARVNLEMNGIVNGEIINKPAEEVAKKRKLYQFDNRDFMLVDPPRAGLDTLTLGLVREFQSVIYIACDARSLARDLREKGLGESHEVKYMAAFDHFPWHAEFLEVVCWLERRASEVQCDDST